MSATYPCPHCQTTVAVGATRCWLCKGSLPRVGVAATPAVAKRDRTWLVIVILASLVLLLVGAQLWAIAPGLLVPYGVLVLPVSVVLARIAWVGRLDFWRSDAASAEADAAEAAARASAQASASALGAAAAPTLASAQAGADAYPRNLDGAVQGRGDRPGDKVIKGLAIGVTVFLVVTAVVLMLLVAAVVIFAIICFASLP
ncbi:MAG: hypothetical protein H6718_22470 [Polyangiaceae bacterium]|nr:hypothetical protein [Myxococcales bacterium]MCB9588190.1 hypothetical protein [Polyangiaceae bacterium]